MSAAPPNLAAKARAIIAHELQQPERLVTDGARLNTHLEADAIALTDLSFALEDGFGIDFTDDEICAVDTVSDLILLVERKVAALNKPETMSQ